MEKIHTSRYSLVLKMKHLLSNFHYASSLLPKKLSVLGTGPKMLIKTCNTFDQLFFWKASVIIHESPDIYVESITPFLGTFRTTAVNPLKCIGVIMENSD